MRNSYGYFPPSSLYENPTTAKPMSGQDPIIWDPFAHTALPIREPWETVI